MKEWIVEPLNKVGEIHFKMTREEVRKILGDFKEFKKTKYSKNTTDDFNFCHVFYDINNICEAIEIFDSITIKIGNSKIFPGDFSNAINILSQIDENLEIEKDSCISINKSIGVSASNNKVESILFGKKGYYQ
ncbi:hypothetical protein V7087_00110 [Neobacillus niacini]|uniref:hypothetical protein n=1 Tax=Neobacillus niacini TaxID=86668 RepID=UPI002FFDE86B